MFFILKILAFFFGGGDDVTNLEPNFGFANMGYLIILFERTFPKDVKDLKTEKSFEICLSNQKI